jgi:hypothetical protein
MYSLRSILINAKKNMCASIDYILTVTKEACGICPWGKRNSQLPSKLHNTAITVV